MNRVEATTYDIFEMTNTLNYISEAGAGFDKEQDKDIKGNPVSDEVKESSKNKGVIGKIAGVGADSNEPTRNGRRYPVELWQNVEKSEYFIEGMENRTIIGEADHPDERLDYSVKEGAVTLTKYEIKEDGKVYTEFDILDTLPGRTVKTYFDAGCRLGVSSRGLGEEVCISGEKIIDPESYQFYCFDVVAFPAVKSARMELIESTSPKKEQLIKSITTEIKNCTSIDEVKFIESLSRSVNLYLEEIEKSIEDKKSQLEKQIKLKEDIEELKNEVLNEDENASSEDNIDNNNKIKISEPSGDTDEDTTGCEQDSDDQNLILLAELEEKLHTRDLKIEQQQNVIKNLVAKSYTQVKQIQEQTEAYNLLVQNHSVELSEQTKFKTENDDKLTEVTNENISLKSQLEELTKKYEKLQKVNKEFSNISESVNKKTEDINAVIFSKDKQINELQKQLSQTVLESKHLQTAIGKLKEQIISETQNGKQLLTESDSKFKTQLSNLEKKNHDLSSKNEKLEKAIEIINSEKQGIDVNYKESLNKYISVVCNKYNLKVETMIRLLGENYTIKDIDSLAKELAKNETKMNSLPFVNLVPDRSIIVENIGLKHSDDLDHEVLDSFKFMVNSKN